MSEPTLRDAVKKLVAALDAGVRVSAQWRTTSEVGPEWVINPYRGFQHRLQVVRTIIHPVFTMAPWHLWSPVRGAAARHRLFTQFGFCSPPFQSRRGSLRPSDPSRYRPGGPLVTPGCFIASRRTVLCMCCESAPTRSLLRNTPAPNGTRNPSNSNEMRAKSAPSLGNFAPRRKP